jgi:hypothetical protein
MDGNDTVAVGVDDDDDDDDDNNNTECLLS